MESQQPVQAHRHIALRWRFGLRALFLFVLALSVLFYIFLYDPIPTGEITEGEIEGWTPAYVKKRLDDVEEMGTRGGGGNFFCFVEGLTFVYNADSGAFETAMFTSLNLKGGAKEFLRIVPDDLALGMTAEDVAKVLGKPSCEHMIERYELVFREYENVSGDWRKYFLRFDHDRLSSIGVSGTPFDEHGLSVDD